MKWLHRIVFLVLASGMLVAQTGTSSPSSAPADTTLSNEVTALRQALAEQQKQIDELKAQLSSRDSSSAPPKVVDAAYRTPLTVSTPAPDQEEKKESPISFRIGNAEFTPGGFVDFTSVFRSTNVGGLGTSFGGIPFSNTSQGKLSEVRLTPQNSRVSLKIADKFGANDVTGYLEADFLGNDATNAFVTSNSHTNRLRLYWVDLKRDKWEFLGGQSWSWLTPNRVGMSPMPGDIFYTQNMDTNYQVGLTWTRAAQFRVAYHPNKHWGMGVALENPEQFIGANNAVILPTGLSAALGTELDQNGGLAGVNTPNLHPDIIPKLTYDTDMNGRHFHVEGAGLLTSVRVATIPPGATTFLNRTSTGGGASAAVNLEVVKNFRLVANAFYSDGGGRYIFGLGPSVVIRPDGFPSMVHSGSGIAGFEAQVTPTTLIAGYYGGAYFQRNFFPDTAATTPVKPLIGFGFPGSNPNATNRAIQEGTVDWVQTFWKNPQYGALQLIGQYSYLTRAPWFVALGAPKNAHLSMGYADLRFTLP